jgi:hypothetical protein
MTVDRVAVVLAAVEAVPPPGIPAVPFAQACCADTYEVLAGMEEIVSGIAGSEDHEDLLWPESVLVPATTVREVADWAAGRFGALVVVPADAPDLPQLVVAKVFKALVRAQVCVAPERAGAGSVAIGVQLPWPGWLPDDLTLDADHAGLSARAPQRRLLARGPDWHRLRTPAAVDRLDPGLEGWEETRALLAGRRLEHGLG